MFQVDGKVRTDPKFPAGFMDVIQVEKTGENFRLIYDVKGRSVEHERLESWTVLGGLKVSSMNLAGKYLSKGGNVPLMLQYLPSFKSISWPHAFIHSFTDETNSS